ncbi:hypothetical protein IC006_0133 [Sulfuracidifex tepidarius]|uniref:Uncharacterized protein n=1 Tax=Sulfuracidifex tepidarius TaxID=1294262 RepID=A0A510DRN4_9CREN|nr:hypothetical protein [Sulfuracidifex tepidarius]BBG22849.1 hypothetical protein IC006_0133 [Sulfuracidifex tepidarius]
MIVNVSKVKRGVAVAVFMLIMIIVLVAVLVPAYFVFESTPSYYQQVHYSGESQLQGYQKQEVFKGEPSIYYNSSESPYLEFNYSSVPIVFNISEVYYFSPTSSQWVVAVNNTMVEGSGDLPLPTSAFNNPILIVTSVGNIFFLNPNSSIASVSTVALAGKSPVYILAVGLNGTNVIPLTAGIVFNGQTAKTPEVFYVDPGTYTLSAEQSQVFIDGLTGNFYQWTSVGSGGVRSPTSMSTGVSVSGPLIITLEYKMVFTKYEVTFSESGIPLNGKIQEGTVSICPVNSTITLVVDNKTYQLGPNGLTLDLTYGYHEVQFQDPVYEYFNYDAPSIGKVPYGEIQEYKISGNVTNSNVSVSGEYIFVSGNGEFSEKYESSEVLYALITENHFYLPQGSLLEQNSTPILGDIAGQLIETEIDGQTVVLGPTKNFENETLYYPSGTNIQVNYDYLDSISGKFEIDLSYYKDLLSNPTLIEVYCAGNMVSHKVNIANYPDVSFSFTLYSPTLLVNQEEWNEGGVTL